jgi:hypothetical protein
MDAKRLRDTAELALRIAARMTDDVLREQLKRIAADHIAQAERWEKLGRRQPRDNKPDPDVSGDDRR